jgi:hypothetical protein
MSHHNRVLEIEKTELLVLVSILLPNEYLKYIEAQLVVLQQQMKPELDDTIGYVRGQGYPVIREKLHQG